MLTLALCIWQAGLSRVKANLQSRVKKGVMTQKAADSALSKLKGTLDYHDFKSVDMVLPPVLMLLLLDFNMEVHVCRTLDQWSPALYASLL